MYRRTITFSNIVSTNHKSRLRIPTVRTRARSVLGMPAVPSEATAGAVAEEAAAAAEVEASTGKRGVGGGLASVLAAVLLFPFKLVMAILRLLFWPVAALARAAKRSGGGDRPLGSA